MNQKSGSSLSRNVSSFANCLSGLCMLLLTPKIAQHIRPDIMQYFATSIPYDWALWGSWGFTVLLGACGYFGLSALFQMAIQLLFHKTARHKGI